MKKVSLLLTLVLLAIAALVPASASASRIPQARENDGRVVVANRGSGSISIIDVETNTLLETIDLPGDNPSEPMYVTYSQRGDHVFVGDRGNDQVVVFNAADFSIAATIPTAAGVWHMWSDPHDRQLWVNGDIDNSATVINPQTLAVITTVPMPADLVAAGYVPHDVILEPMGRFAYVTMVGGDGENDYVVQFSTASFQEVNRVAVGKDPHVSLNSRDRQLYVPAQNGDVVHVFNRSTLQPVTDIAVPGAHGAWMAFSGRVFYTTNLPGGGTNGLFAIDTRSNTVIDATDTPYPAPHNVVVTPSNNLFLTHSGPTADKVTIYTVSNTNHLPVLTGEVTVGLNPFGLAYVP